MVLACRRGACGARGRERIHHRQRPDPPRTRPVSPYTHTHTRNPCPYTHIHTHTQSMPLHTRIPVMPIHTHTIHIRRQAGYTTHIRRQAACLPAYVWGVRCMCLCACVCVCSCVCVRVNLYVCLCVRVCRRVGEWVCGERGVTGAESGCCVSNACVIPKDVSELVRKKARLACRKKARLACLYHYCCCGGLLRQQCVCDTQGCVHCCLLRIAYDVFRLTYYVLCVTCYVLLITSYVIRIAYH